MATQKLPDKLSGGKVIARGSTPMTGGFHWGSTSSNLSSATIAAAQAPTMPAAPSAPAAPPAPSSTPAAQGPDIRDPAYWLDQANINQYYGTQSAQYTALSAQDKIALDRATTLLGENETKGLHAADVGANKAGLFYSSELGKTRGDIELNYTRDVFNANQDYTGRQQLRDIGQRDLVAQFGPGGLKTQEALQAGKDRQLARDQEAAKNNALASPPTAAGPAAATLAATYSGQRGLVGDKYIDKDGGIHATMKKDGKTYYLTGSGKWQVI